MDEPWVPDNFGLGLGVACVSLVCWGTWSNTAKAAERLPFAYYYYDFSLGVFAAAAVAFATIGAQKIYIEEEGKRYTLNDDKTLYRFLAAVGAGAVFNVANLLLVVAIQIAGLSVAFPIAIGTALVLGTVLTYLIDEAGRPEFLFPGVGLGLLAIIAMSLAHRQKDREANQAVSINRASYPHTPTVVSECTPDGQAYLHPHPHPELTEKVPLLRSGSDNDSSSSGGLRVVDEEGGATDGPVRGTLFKLVVCIVSGLLMSLWSPLAAYSRDSKGEGLALTTYGSFLFYTATVVVTTPILVALQNAGILLPRVGPRVRLSLYCCRPLSEHGWGLLGGLIWSVGTLANLLSGDEIGYAIGYAIGQSAPMVATLWGLLYYREFEGCSNVVMAYLAAMFVFYGGAVGIIAYGGSG
eukprot:m.155676 g.155676  ORF g.155676 m.155676 type:complete len:410 (-) comp23578_c0_seq1:147-1376(-)